MFADDQTDHFQPARRCRKNDHCPDPRPQLNDRGLRVLLVDADPQGSIGAVPALKPNTFLHDLLIRRLALRECLMTVRPGLYIICGNRHTTEAETTTMGLPFREFIFKHLLGEYEKTTMLC